MFVRAVDVVIDDMLEQKEYMRKLKGNQQDSIPTRSSSPGISNLV